MNNQRMAPDPRHLSHREREVLAGLLRGKSELQIAADLFLAPLQQLGQQPTVHDRSPLKDEIYAAESKSQRQARREDARPQSRSV